MEHRKKKEEGRKPSDPAAGEAADKTGEFVRKETERRGSEPEVEKARPRDTNRMGA
jgi:hypothetical protein